MKIQDAIDELTKPDGRSDFQIREADLTDQELIKLGSAVSITNRKIKLSLNTDRFRIAGLQAIADSTVRAKHPIQLLLSGYKLDDESTKLLATAIKDSTHDVDFLISYNKIGDEGVRLLAEAIPQTEHSINLRLSVNNITIVGLRHISKAIKNTKSSLMIDLYKSQIGVLGIQALVEQIKDVRQDIELGLSENMLGDEGAKIAAIVISEVAGKVTLNLSFNNIGVEGAKGLASAIKARKSNKPLVLNLYGNNIGDEGLQAIAQAIEEVNCPIDLDLYENNIGVEGARAVAEAIKKARYPLKLSLYHNLDIGDDGAMILADAMAQGAYLEELVLCGCNIRSQGAVAIAKAAEKIKRPLILHLGGTDNDIGQEGVIALAKTLKKSEYQLNLKLMYKRDQDSKGTKALASAIAQARFPSKLYLVGCDIRDEGEIAIAAALKVTKHLVNLELISNIFEEIGQRVLDRAVADNIVILGAKPEFPAIIEDFFNLGKEKFYKVFNESMASIISPDAPLELVDIISRGYLGNELVIDRVVNALCLHPDIRENKLHSLPEKFRSKEGFISILTGKDLSVVDPQQVVEEVVVKRSRGPDDWRSALRPRKSYKQEEPQVESPHHQPNFWQGKLRPRKQNKMDMDSEGLGH